MAHPVIVTAELVRTLVTNGSLKRRRTRRDARIYAVRITPLGRQTLATGASAAHAAEEELLLRVPEKQRAVLLHLLRIIALDP